MWKEIIVRWLKQMMNECLSLGKNWSKVFLRYLFKNWSFKNGHYIVKNCKKVVQHWSKKYFENGKLLDFSPAYFWASKFGRFQIYWRLQLYVDNKRVLFCQLFVSFSSMFHLLAIRLFTSPYFIAGFLSHQKFVKNSLIKLPSKIFVENLSKTG